MSYFCSYELQSYYKNVLVQRLERQLQEIKFFLLNTSLGYGPTGLDHNQLKTYANISGLRLTLIDEEGNVISDSRVAPDSLRYLQNHLMRPEVQTANSRGFGIAERESATLSQSMLYAAYRLEVIPHHSHLKKMKYIRIAISTVKVHRVLAALRWKIYVGGAIAMLLLAAASYWTSNRLTAPIVQLTQTAEAVKKGVMDVHFTRTSRDEIGDLADLLNEMLDKLSDDMVKMRKLEEVRTQFLGNVSHELRTPIFAIQGYLETLLQNRLCDYETQTDFLDKAYRQSVRLNTLLRDLVDISRIESGEMKMIYHTFPVHAWLEKIVADFQTLAQENGVTLSFSNHDTDTAIKISGDVERLGQVLNNLITNAIKYNNAGGSVQVGYKADSRTVTIFVSDTGRGIAPEYIARIFERFYRIDKERSRAVGGTGLGLAIVKHIVEAHKSRIRVESVVGQGSTFSFEVKKVEEQAFSES